MSDNYLLLYTYKIISLSLGFVVMFMGMFFGFSGGACYLIAPGLALLFCGVVLSKTITSRKKTIGMIASIVGAASYGLFLINSVSYLDNSGGVGWFDISILGTLMLSIILYRTAALHPKTG